MSRSGRKRTEQQLPEPEGVVYVVSLGCPKNLVDTEVMTGVLLSSGFCLSMDPAQADIYLINTCAFIPPARSETEAAIEDARTWKTRAPEQRRIVVAGCLVQWDRTGSWRERFPEVDLWLGVDRIPDIAGLLKNNESGYQSTNVPLFLYDEKTPRLQLTLPHIAYLKIADGCNNRCSYCAIPDIRGNLRSRLIGSVVAEAVTALNNGASELLLMAQDITAFGADRGGGGDLSALLTELDKLPGIFWIRLLYTHPAHFSRKLIETIAGSRHVIPYVDIPLQHISDKLLKSMRRHISEAAARELLADMRAEIPHLALRTTFITGLPGETADDFKLLKDFVLEQEFERLGVFSYFPEPETPAAGFPDQVPAALAEERAAEIMEIQAKIALKKNNSLVGREFDVIVDFVEDSGTLGRTYMDAPEIDNIVVMPDVFSLAPGQICKTLITGADTYELTAGLKNK
ncbi:MAG: 30S ribosomal protein S12 methylthiotransferase RimO [Victivallaceae bacterium]|nr:30S ribosomal protein S12 methylthiotransferase RimO [Victivallaceae bacterium]